MIQLSKILKENMSDTYNIGMKKYKVEKPKLSQNEEKKKGIDGKPCWKGYRYAGTENGKDKCVPISESEMCNECGSQMFEGMCMECGWDNETEMSSYDGGYEHDEESVDHEVSMAQNLLKDIVKNATELMQKIGDDEFDIPAWIQDHISQAQNYINQANTGYYEQ